jgi:hypothetical protein
MPQIHELCQDWGWYIDIDINQKANNTKNKYYNKISIKITDENNQNEEYDYYMSQYDNNKQKNLKSTYLVKINEETCEEEEQEQEHPGDKDDGNKKKVAVHKCFCYKILYVGIVIAIFSIVILLSEKR